MRRRCGRLWKTPGRLLPSHAISLGWYIRLDCGFEELSAVVSTVLVRPSTLKCSLFFPANKQEAPMASVILPSIPSESRPGRFGIYGGRYVPETLMAALVELEHEYDVAKADAAFQAELAGLLKDFAGPAYAALLCQAADRRTGRREDLPEARRPAAHRRAQDQQRTGPGAAGEAHGQEADHRRDRRGAARRGDGHGLRAAGHGMRDLHGRRGHGAPGAERAAHAAAGRGGARGFVGLEDAEGRHQRGHARLGHQRADHLLSAGLARWGRILIRPWCGTSIAASAGR